MHFHLVIQLLNDTLGLIKILFTTHFQVCLLIDSLNTDLKTEQSFWNIIMNKLNNIRMQNIRSDLKLEDILRTMIFQNKFENIDRKILFNIESAIQKFNDLTMLHHIEQCS